MAAQKKTKKIKVTEETREAKTIKDKPKSALTDEQSVDLGAKPEGAPEVTKDVKAEAKKIIPISGPLNKEEDETEASDFSEVAAVEQPEPLPVSPTTAPEVEIKTPQSTVDDNPEPEISQQVESNTGQSINIFENEQPLDQVSEEDLDLAVDKTVGELSEAASLSDPENEFDDVETEAAVDDIVAEESDAILLAEDAAKDEENGVSVIEARKTNKFKDLLSLPAVRWGFGFGVLLLIGILSLLPTTRYSLLNLFGVRSSSTVTVQDSATRLPLKNVAVSLQGQTIETDQDGKAVFNHLRLGKTSLEVKKRGFGSVNRDVVLGWGSNPIPAQDLTATGTVYVLTLKDYPSDKQVTKAEATSGEYSAKPNEKGEVRLVTEPSEKDTEITVKADGYREEKLIFTLQDKLVRDVYMVPARPVIFVSKRAGNYSLYRTDADGKNEKVILEATGKERDDYNMLAHPSENIVAVTSTRDGHRNNDGYLLNGLFIIDPSSTNPQPARIGEAERVQIIDWVGDYLIYSEVREGGSAASPTRSRLKSYNFKTYDVKELATTNYFNEITLFDGYVYYAPSAYAVNVDTVKFYKVKPDAKDLQVVLDKEVWSVVRTGFDSISFNSQNTWFEVKSGGSATKQNGAPASLKGRDYHEGPGQISLWTEDRDGKGVLLLRDAKGEEKTLTTVGGLRQPVRWLNSSTLSYRVVTGSESADYTLSLLGGDAKKVVDVTNTGGAESFQN